MKDNWCDTEIDSFSAESEGIEKRERVFNKIMIESLPGSFSISDANGQLVWWNTFFREEVVGKGERDMFLTGALEVFHPDDRALALEKMLSVLNLGIEETDEARVLLRGGPKFHWRMITGKRIIIDREPFVVAIGIDITERKRFDAIMAFRLHLQNIMDSSSLDELLRVTIDEAERLTQSSIGFFHIVADDQMAFSMGALSTRSQTLERERYNVSLNEQEILADVLLKRGALIDNNYEASTSRGVVTDADSAIQRILVIPLMRGVAVTALLCVGGKSYDYDEDDLKMVGDLANFAWDIISRHRAELSEQKIQEALFLAQKMELIGQLAGGVAHDFNNMLGVILGNAEMALNQPAIEEPLLGNMTAIFKAAEHSSVLCNQLIAFSRKQCVMPIVLDLNVMVERGIAFLTRLLGENITLVWLPIPSIIPIKIDPAQIDLILGNLCVNSRDAIQGIGKISIETSRIHVDKAACTDGHTCSEPGDYVVLSVTDDGCGIEKKHLPFIFQPFFTTKEKRTGTGMGLATIYGILKQNSASIECSSEPGRGTSFKIYFPLYKGYANANSDADKSDLLMPSIGHSKELILLVDDEPDMLSICKLMLENRGYMVLIAAALSTAIRIADEHKGQIQLLITDVVLPEMNGCDLSNKLQTISPNLKTLFMSGYAADIENYQGVFDLDVNFIQKPFSIKTLLGAVKKILTHP